MILHHPVCAMENLPCVAIHLHDIAAVGELPYALATIRLSLAPTFGIDNGIAVAPARPPGQPADAEESEDEDEDDDDEEEDDDDGDEDDEDEDEDDEDDGPQEEQEDPPPGPR